MNRLLTGLLLVLMLVLSGCWQPQRDTYIITETLVASDSPMVMSAVFRDKAKTGYRWTVFPPGRDLYEDRKDLVWKPSSGIYQIQVTHNNLTASATVRAEEEYPSLHFVGWGHDNFGRLLALIAGQNRSQRTIQRLQVQYAKMSQDGYVRATCNHALRAPTNIPPHQSFTVFCVESGGSLIPWATDVVFD